MHEFDWFLVAWFGTGVALTAVGIFADALVVAVVGTAGSLVFWPVVAITLALGLLLRQVL